MKSDLLKYIIQANCSIEEAWNKIELNRRRSVIVVQGQKVVGTLSDGDIRKAVMSKRLLNTSVRDVMNTNFISLPSSQKSKAEEVARQNDIFLIPIVGKNLRLLDVFRFKVP
jgi:CBS domain-containing protein